MNRTIKSVLAAAAVSAMIPAYAQDAEVEEEGVVGWTPVAIGLATPVQVPWGLNKWNVYGIDVNLFYTDAPRLYGIGVGGLAELTRDTGIGILVGGLANVAFEDIYGLRATFGFNYAQKSVYGAEVGLAGVRDTLHGLDIELLGSFQRYVCGCQIGGLVNVSAVESYGANIAGISNIAETSYGLQLALLFNGTRELHGAQVGLVNYTEDCPSGFQIGLVNIILQNKIPVLPFVNAYF